MFVLTHDNPDPDALASAAALSVLIESVSPAKTRIAFGGIVGRSENRALIQEMKVTFERIEDIEIPAAIPVALVDTQPRAGNNSLPAGRIVSVVIDHHPPRPDTIAATFTDIRPEFGAGASMLVEYLRAARIDLPPWLATALFYAIQSDTMDLGRETSPADIETSGFLYPLCDPAAVSRIRHARVPASYFRSLHDALATARLHDRVIVASMGTLPYPDMVAEVADLFLQMHGVEWTVALGRHRDRLLLSVRARDTGAHAGTLIREAMGDRGSAGGHGTFAGGQIAVRGRTEEDIEVLRAGLLADLLVALGADPAVSEPLVGADATGGSDSGPGDGPDPV